MWFSVSQGKMIWIPKSLSVLVSECGACTLGRSWMITISGEKSKHSQLMKPIVPGDFTFGPPLAIGIFMNKPTAGQLLTLPNGFCGLLLFAENLEGL